MSVEQVVYHCNCAKPDVRLDDESGNEFCAYCGGLVEIDLTGSEGIANV